MRGGKVDNFYKPFAILAFPAFFPAEIPGIPAEKTGKAFTALFIFAYFTKKIKLSTALRFRTEKE